jgi:hypothetical protein
MVAMQKQRMWRVALAHFGLTLCVTLILVSWNAFSAQRLASFNPDLAEQHIRHYIWIQFWYAILISLQPISYFAVVFSQQLYQHSILPTHPYWFLISFEFALIFLTAPIWSICFGWLFVKLDNWLNHFPMLGKKVF